MNIMITGGHGFVGKSVEQELRRKDYNISCLSRRDGLDLREFQPTRDIMFDLRPDVIVNLASHGGSLHYVTDNAADVIHDNILLVLNLYRSVLEACPGAIIINPIANCSYPGDSEIQVESRFWDGPVHESVWSFGNSRRAWLTIAECYEMQYGIRSINLMIPNAYGPGDYDDPNKAHALTGMVLRMLDAQTEGAAAFEVWGSGKPIREWIYVDDIARIIGQVVEPGLKIPSQLNVAQNEGYSVSRLAELIRAAIGYDGRMVFNTQYQDGAPEKRLDDRLFRSVFPEFTFTPIARGIKNTVASYRRLREE